MAIAFVAVATLLRGPMPTPQPVRLTAGFAALRNPALRTLAITSVFVAPILTRRIGLRPVLFGAFALLGIVLVVMALGVASAAVLVGSIVVAGLILGVLNTSLTETVMEATDLPRPVASSTYSGVRFLGGALAPAVCGGIAAAGGAGAPYWVGAAALAVTCLVLAVGRRHLAAVGRRPHETAAGELEAITLGEVG
ncbi:MAG: hypothetical protein DI570_30295 [Phenylobacterium zucineum]|nr:MAG: hypothetical protein DI570_30295 [Phenylobacterium zucineum]